MNVIQLQGNAIHWLAEDDTAAAAGVRVTRTESAVELRRERPSTEPVYFRIGYGRLEWGTDLRAFQPEVVPLPDPGSLLASLLGQSPPPESTPLPGVRRLTFGGCVRADADGVTVTRVPAVLPMPPSDLASAVAATLPTSGEYAVAYSGGLSSAFVAAVALSVGHHPLLVHGDLGLAQLPAVADVPGAQVCRVPLDVSELLDHQWITGDEPLPPIPEVEIRRRLANRLANSTGTPLFGGGMVEDLVAVKLPEVDSGYRDWRLLGCEPFHIFGTLNTMAEARTLLSSGVVHSPGQRDRPAVEPDAQPVGAPPPPSPTGGKGLPWLTGTGREAMETAHRGAMAVWQEHLDSLEPALARVIAAVEERGDGGMILPGMDLGVIAAAAGMPVARLGRLRGGRLEGQLPLRSVVRRAGITGVREAGTGFWLRLAAADHLHRERTKLIAELERHCVLADLGLVRPEAAIRTLRDGRQIADYALPLLRLIWLNRWLEGRS